MWPEGTRSENGRLQPMKKGFVHLALATRLPIVPIVFHGAHRRWAGKTWRVFPGRLRIEVLPPIDTTDWSAEHVDEHAQQLWQVYQDALDPDQRTLLLEDKLS